MATLLIGYDVEVRDPSLDITKKFLRTAPKLHSELEAPCTFFICGQTLENNLEEFQRVKEGWGDIMDFEQHTYSHVPLKTVVEDSVRGFRVVKGGSLEQIREEVERASELLRRHLGVECIGITGPNCYYRGLMDRPDVLEVLYQAGIRFTRTYGRNEKDFQPVPFQVQPFWYEPQGFPDILECPVQGWQDCIWRGVYGWEKKDDYLKMLKDNVDHIVEHDLVWGYASHDWSSLREDPDMKIIRNLIEYAKQRGVRLMSYRQYYQEALRMRPNIPS